MTKTRPKAKIGIIGGSGTYNVQGAKEVDTIKIWTPFGNPSDSIKIFEIEGKNVAFLPRHGRGHRLNPTEIPVRANIWALKSLGVEKIITISAVGSLREEIKPRDFIIPDQIIDRTKSRVNTFFENGLVAHVAFAEPFCSDLNNTVFESINSANMVKIHRDKTYICMEGPLFSTKAESNLYRSWNADIIGMTALPEAKLAREAEICYCCIAMCTDYDCWHSEHDAVTLEMVIGHMKANNANSQDLLKRIIKDIPEKRKCRCGEALKEAIITDKSTIPEEVKDNLGIIINKYI